MTDGPCPATAVSTGQREAYPPPKPSTPLGKRQLGEDGCESLAPGQRERIVAVATELAFATDEQDRDRLIAELTNALQENNSPDDDDASYGVTVRD